MTKNTETLPIDDFRSAIMECKAPYIIVEAETGSGKSTRVPQWFHELGKKVLATVPLVETARGTAERVAQQVGCKLGSVVGYSTGNIEGRCYGKQTEILYTTNNLTLVRQQSSQGKFNILVLDELHQWSKEQSTLEAWAWRELKEGTLPFEKVVVLSATLKSAELSRKRGNAPVIKVPGRTYPIENRPAGTSILEDVIRLVNEDYDVLVFQPGKGEINDLIFNLQASGLNAELIPFHGELSREDKDRAYQFYSRPKVLVSTNALETGRTILPSPGRKLSVIDSAMERRIELRNGIETLVLVPISLAQSEQRRGRTGRVGPGIYIDHCSPDVDREAFPTPEILRTRLDQTVLRLAVAGYDALELPFFHELDRDVVQEAKRSLYALGALTESGQVTAIGRQMARLPVPVQYARMIVEAQKRGVLDEVITITAILNQGGLADLYGPWQQHVQHERESDLFAQLQLWEVAQATPDKKLREIGIHGERYKRARKTRHKLIKSLGLKEDELTSTSERRDILRACLAGMVDKLFSRAHTDSYKNGDEVTLNLGRESVVYCSDWLVGEPKAIQIKTRRGHETLRLLTMATVVEPSMLIEVAPQLLTKPLSNFWHNNQTGEVITTESTRFNGIVIDSQLVTAPKCPEATETLVSTLMEGEIFPEAKHNLKVQAQLVLLHLEDKRVRLLTDEQLREFYHSKVGDATSRAEIAGLDLAIELTDYIPSELLPKVRSIDLDAIRQQAVFLERDIRTMLWSESLPSGEAFSRLQQLKSSRPSSLAELMMWNLQVQHTIAEIKQELDEQEARRLEAELRRQAERERQAQKYQARERQRRELKNQAEQLRDRADELLSEREESFSDNVYDGLMKIVEPAFLPYPPEELQEWIREAKATIAEAEKTEVPSDMAEALSALQKKFGGTR